MDETTTAPEVTFAQLLRTAIRALADQSLRWVALLMAFAATGYVLLQPNPWRAGAAAVFVALVSPLWLRKERR